MWNPGTVSGLVASSSISGVIRHVNSPLPLILHLWHVFLTGHWLLSERRDFASILLSDWGMWIELTIDSRRKSRYMLVDINILTWPGSFIERSENPKETGLRAYTPFWQTIHSEDAEGTTLQGMWVTSRRCERQWNGFSTRASSQHFNHSPIRHGFSFLASRTRR